VAKFVCPIQTSLHCANVSVDGPWEAPWFDPSAPVQEIVFGRVFKLQVGQLIVVALSRGIEAKYRFELSFSLCGGGMAAVAPQVCYVGQERPDHCPSLYGANRRPGELRQPLLCLFLGLRVLERFAKRRVVPLSVSTSVLRYPGVRASPKTEVRAFLELLPIGLPTRLKALTITFAG